MPMFKFVLQNLDEQYPEKAFTTKRRCVVFRDNSDGIRISIMSSAQMLETSGWVAKVTQGGEVRNNFNAMHYKCLS